MVEPITDCSSTIAEIQCLIASLQFLEPAERWSMAHPLIRPWLPEWDEYGWYSADFEDLQALACSLRAIHRDAVFSWQERSRVSV